MSESEAGGGGGGRTPGVKRQASGVRRQVPGFKQGRGQARLNSCSSLPRFRLFVTIILYQHTNPNQPNLPTYLPTNRH
jgi:hypothetical protein